MLLVSTKWVNNKNNNNKRNKHKLKPPLVVGHVQSVVLKPQVNSAQNVVQRDQKAKRKLNVGFVPRRRQGTGDSG